MIDWREYDFFSLVDGLNVHDSSPECAIAYDCELARDCQPLCTRIATCPNALERAKAWAEAMPYHSRWFTGLTPGAVPERPDLEPLIPTACLLAPWFPAPWLAGSLTERRAVISALERAYAPVRPLMLRTYPLNTDTERMMALVADDGRYMRAVVMFDKAAPIEKRVAQFRKAMREIGPGPAPAPSGRRRHSSAIRALERLCCHRLGLLPVADRDVAAAGIAHLKNGLSRAKLSLSHKWVRTDFEARHYLLPCLTGVNVSI